LAPGDPGCAAVADPVAVTVPVVLRTSAPASASAAAG
jgi:hypothetical protein